MFGTQQRLIKLQLLQPPAESKLWRMVRNTGSLERTYNDCLPQPKRICVLIMTRHFVTLDGDRGFLTVPLEILQATEG